MMTIEQIERLVFAEETFTPSDVCELLKTIPQEELWALAHRVTEYFKPKHFDFCAIVNARSGRCSENCKWCAQSAHWKTSCEVYDWIGTDACVASIRKAEANRVGRLGIVTSGRGQTPKDIDRICEAIRAMKKESSVSVCASLGLLSKSDLQKLKDAGLERVHCNLETAPSLFPSLCSTHTTEEKIATLKAAREVGLEICCGGIFGMGETDEQVVEFAFALKEIAPASIPMNFLDPIPGTPLGGQPFLSISRILTVIAIMRLVNPKTPLRFAGGRRKLSDEDAARAIDVGITAGIQGPLLTTPGADYADDRHLAAKAGYCVE